MFLKNKVVLVWVICLSCTVVLTGCEVVWVNRGALDSFRVGKEGCTYDTRVCTNFDANCRKSYGGVCLCGFLKPNYRNPRSGNDKGYGCVSNYNMRAGVGGSENCAFGPFRLIPYNKNEPTRKFFDKDNPTVVMKSCSLRKVLVKFPDNATEMELEWLDESYVDLNVLNNNIYFKWKRSVPSLQGTIITFNLYCEVQIPGIKADHSYQTKCLRAKVLGKWSADAVPKPAIASTKPKSSQITKVPLPTTKTISSVTVATAAEPKSTASTSSDEDYSNWDVSNKIFIALFSISFVVIVVLGIIVGFLWKDRKRMQDKNLKITELETIDEQRNAITGDDISTYDEVVTKSGIHSEKIYDESFPSSRHNNNEHLSAGHQNEEASNYEPLRRNPLQDRKDEHNYQSLITSRKGK